MGLSNLRSSLTKAESRSLIEEYTILINGVRLTSPSKNRMKGRTKKKELINPKRVMNIAIARKPKPGK